MHKLLKKYSLASMVAIALPYQAHALDVVGKQLEVYGTLAPFMTTLGHDDATPPPAAALNSLVPVTAYTTAGNIGTKTSIIAGGSNVGFRGTYPFPLAGYYGFYQAETGVSLTGTAGTGFGSRATFVGIGGGFGRVFIGSNYTPYFYACCWTSIFKTSTASDVNLIGVPAINNVPVSTQQAGRTGTTADAVFSARRQGNSINYASPDWNGLVLRLQYSPDATKGQIGTTGETFSPVLYSGALLYEKGPVVLKGAYQNHRDYFGLSVMSTLAGTGASAVNPSSRDVGTVLTAGFRFRTETLVAGSWERLSYKNDGTVAGNVNEYERDSWSVYVEQDWKPHRISLRYASADRGTCQRVGGAACTTDGLEARAWGLQYAYFIDRNWDIVAAAWMIKNGHSATYNTSDRLAGPGEKQQAVAVGLQVKF